MPPAIAIDQSKPSGQVRSTVDTQTDTYSLLRLLYSRAGQPFVGYSDAFSFRGSEWVSGRYLDTSMLKEVEAWETSPLRRRLAWVRLNVRKIIDGTLAFVMHGISESKKTC